MTKYFTNHFHLTSDMFRKVLLFGIMVLSLTSWCFTACAKQEEEAKKPAEVSPQAAPAQEAEKTKGPVDLITAIVQVAQQAIPAVVHIEVTQRQTVTSPLLPFENDPFFRRFFGVPETPRKFKRELKGLGTGMIMD